MSPLPSEFPRLPLIVEAAFGVDLSDPGSWTRTDLSDRLLAQTIKVTRGRQDESSRTQPSKTSFELSNLDGHLTPEHPASPWWPDVAPGVPIWLRLDRTVLAGIPAARSWAQLVTLDDDISTPSDPSFGGGDLTVAVQVSRDGTHAQQQDDIDDILLASRRDPEAEPELFSWSFGLSGDLPFFAWSPDGTTGSIIQLFSSTPVPDGDEAVRVLLDVDDGAGGATVTFETAPSIDGPWTPLSGLSSGSTTSVHDSGLPIVLGGRPETVDHGVDGRLLAAVVEVDGAVVADPDMRDLSPGAADFTDGQGNTWSFDGNAQIIRDDPAQLFAGQVGSWSPHWPHGDQSGPATPGEARVGVSAAGVLRRIGQGEAVVESPLRREILATADDWPLLHYVPFEDGPEASVTEIALGAEGVDPGRVGSAHDAPGTVELTGSRPVLGSAEDGGGNAHIGGLQVESHWRATWFQQFSPPSSGSTVKPFAFLHASGPRSLGDGTPFDYYAVGWDMSSDELILELVDEDLVVVASQSMPIDDGTIDLADHDWWILSLGIAATEAAFLALWLPGETGAPTRATTGIGLTNAGTLTAVNLGRRAESGQQWAVGHLMVSKNDVNTWTPEEVRADGARAYAGEPAGLRFWRLAGQAGLPAEVRGSARETALMGPQPDDTLLPLLRECVSADRGILAERDDIPGLAMRPHRSLYNQAPAVELDAGADADPWRPGDVINPVSPTSDDQGLRNDVTVQRGQGTARQVVDDASIKARGRYTANATVNVASDSQLGSLARWLLHVGTWPGMRYPPISSELTVARDGTLADWVTAREGDLIEVDGLPPQHPPGAVGLLAQQLVDTVTPTAWTAQVAAIAAGPYEVGVRDDDVRGKRDSGASTLASDFVAGTDTSMSVTVDGLLWTTAAGDFPFDLSVGGARITVTAISGASSPQTFTVDQAPVNGIEKTVPAGSPVRLWRPTIRAL